MKPAHSFVGGGGENTESTSKPTQKQRKRRKRGNIKELQLVLWSAIETAQQTLEAAETSDDMRLKAANSLAQLVYSYTRLDAYLSERPISRRINTGTLQMLKEQEAAKQPFAQPPVEPLFSHFPKPQ
jgi:hypothetical protein